MLRAIVLFSLLLFGSAHAQPIPPSGGGVVIVPSPSTNAGIVPGRTTSALSGLVLKNSSGNVYSVGATNMTATTGFLALLNATTIPADGPMQPVACVLLPANSSASISYGDIPAFMPAGAVAVVTSASTCFTKTTGVITAHISGAVK